MKKKFRSLARVVIPSLLSAVALSSCSKEQNVRPAIVAAQPQNSDVTYLNPTSQITAGQSITFTWPATGTYSYFSAQATIEFSIGSVVKLKYQDVNVGTPNSGPYSYFDGIASVTTPAILDAGTYDIKITSTTPNQPLTASGDYFVTGTLVVAAATARPSNGLYPQSHYVGETHPTNYTVQWYRSQYTGGTAMWTIFKNTRTGTMYFMSPESQVPPQAPTAGNIIINPSSGSTIASQGLAYNGASVTNPVKIYIPQGNYDIILGAYSGSTKYLTGDNFNYL